MAMSRTSSYDRSTLTPACCRTVFRASRASSRGALRLYPATARGSAMTSQREPEILLEFVKARKEFVLDDGLINRLTRKRRLLRALDDVSLTVRRGEIVGLVGESGSGKSTLAQAAVRLLTVDEGYVNYRGENLASARGRALKDFRRSVQMVFQDTGSSLNPRKTVGRALDESLALRGLARARRAERSNELLDVVGLEGSLRQRYPHPLSGGPRHGAAIA